MRVVPVYFTVDVAAARRFLDALGLSQDWASDTGTWVSMTGAGGGVGIHDAAAGEPPRPAGSVELSFESEEPLEHVADRLRDAGFDSTIIDERFGRSLRTVGPDGHAIQINAAMTDSYGYTRPED